jgi:hypothetical protein
MDETTRVLMTKVALPDTEEIVRRFREVSGLEEELLGAIARRLANRVLTAAGVVNAVRLALAEVSHDYPQTVQVAMCGLLVSPFTLALIDDRAVREALRTAAPAEISVPPEYP